MSEINGEVVKGNQGLGEVLEGILNDLTNIRTAVNALVVDNTHNRSVMTVLVAKLNADGSVSDTDYAGPTTATAAAVTTLETTQA